MGEITARGMPDSRRGGQTGQTLKGGQGHAPRPDDFEPAGQNETVKWGIDEILRQGIQLLDAWTIGIKESPVLDQIKRRPDKIDIVHEGVGKPMAKKINQTGVIMSQMRKSRPTRSLLLISSCPCQAINPASPQIVPYGQAAQGQRTPIPSPGALSETWAGMNRPAPVSKFSLFLSKSSSPAKNLPQLGRLTIN